MSLLCSRSVKYTVSLKKIVWKQFSSSSNQAVARPDRQIIKRLQKRYYTNRDADAVANGRLCVCLCDEDEEECPL